jgi:hypothetical protein
VPDKDLGDQVSGRAAKSGAIVPGLDLHGVGDDPDLAHVIRAWPLLPQHVRTAILDMIESAGQP